MPLLALTLSLLFSVLFVVRDCRRRRDVSAAVWIPTIFFMVLASRPVSLWISGRTVRLGIENANELATSSIDQFFYLVSLTSAFVIVTVRRIKWGKLLSSNSALILFYLFFAISVFWSSDPSGSSKRLFKDFGVVFLAGVIFTEKNPLEALRALYLRSAFILLPLSVVFIKYFPTYGRAYSGAGEMAFTGVTTQKNSLGEIVLIFMLFMTWDYLETYPGAIKFRLNRIPWDLLIPLYTGVWLLKLSQSKSSLVCTLVGLFLVLRGGRLLSRFVSGMVLLGALSLPLFVIFSAQFSDVMTPVLHALGRDATFTGRTDIWNHITLQTVNPLIGSGYWNFWGGPGGFQVNQNMHEVIPNAHNGYVDLYLDGGIIGLVLLLILLVTRGQHFAQGLRGINELNRYYRLRFAVLIALIIFNISESAYGRAGPIWFTALVMFWSFPAMAGAGKVKSGLRREVQSEASLTPAVLMEQLDGVKHA